MTQAIEIQPSPRSGAETYAHLLADHGGDVETTPRDQTVMRIHNNSHAPGVVPSHYHKDAKGSGRLEDRLHHLERPRPRLRRPQPVVGGSAANDCVTTSTNVNACQAGAGLGATFMLGVVLFITLVGNGTLGVAYAIFRKQP